ncbi:MAG: (d)CMP kinase [Balneolales bacterium]
MLIVIDGPAGAGKSSTAKAVARIAGIDYIDSGALYRGFALLYILNGENKSKFFEIIDDDVLSFKFNRDQSEIFVSGKNMTEEIRTGEVSSTVSTIAAFPEVREKVSVYLKQAALSRNCIAEGRDLGTVVFPDADLKFFLTADINERAKRRQKEMSAGSDEVDLDKIKENLVSRDAKDSSRKAAPLKKADDAIEIDTTRTTFDEQVNCILTEIEKHKNKQLT